MRWSVLIFAVLIGGVASGLAQSGGIRWQSDPQQAVAASQQTQLPLMCYLIGSSDDRDQRLERDQRRAMADPRVIPALEALCAGPHLTCPAIASFSNSFICARRTT